MTDYDLSGRPTMPPSIIGDDRCYPEEHEPEGRWRVFSDGTPLGTRIIGPDGREVRYAVSVRFDIEANSSGSLAIEIAPPVGATVIADDATVSFDCPHCGEKHICKGPPF